MRKHVPIAVAVVAAVALVVAGMAFAKGQTPVHVKAGNLELTFNGGLTPEAISKTKLTPVSFNVSGKIDTVDKTHPPALQEFILEADKNTATDVKGLPSCTAAKLQSQDTKHAEAICRSSIIGTGQVTAEVQFPEQNPITVPSKLVVFNGGEKGGATTFFIHAYFTAPITGAIVTTVKITKIHNGRFGQKAVASIPKIAGGSGSVKEFNLSINKRGVLLAKCPDGKIQAHGEAKFADGTHASAEVIRTCVGKG